MRPGERVIVALLLSFWGLSSGPGAVPSVGAVSTALPLEARQAGTQPIVKILYYEGEPRWEVKFLRQAVADDERLQVSLLQRTAENMFLVLGGDGPDDLRAGFPATREELGQYRVLILGSIEASAFSDTQLQLIVEFVEAGGGLLMLAGRRSFGEGGWAATEIADLLPVEIPLPAPGTAPPVAVEVQVSPTPLGLTHPATQIGADPGETQRLFAALPPLSVVNQIGPVKGTGLTLLVGASPEGNKTVLAYQPYRLGTVLALTAQDSWLWQMHYDITPDLDQVYTSFWRQTLHWLADSVPD